jgi:hypothetical protein
LSSGAVTSRRSPWDGSLVGPVSPCGVLPSAFPSLGFDPAPGDLPAVERLVVTVDRSAALLDRVRRQLAQVGRPGAGWRGEAASAFAERLGTLPDYLDRSATSVAEVRAALAQWARRLQEMQASARAYERAAAEAERALAAALAALRAAASSPPVGPFADPSDVAARERAAALVRRAQAQVDSAAGALEQVRRRAAALREEHQRIAERVAAGIRAALDRAPAEPALLERLSTALTDLVDWVASVPERVDRFAEEHAATILAVADVLSEAATVLGLLALVVPPPVGLVLLGAAAGATGLALTGHLLADGAGADVDGFTYAGDVLGVAGPGVRAVAKGAAVVRAERGTATTGTAGARGTKQVVRSVVQAPVPARVRAVASRVDEAATASGAVGTVRSGGTPYQHWVPDSVDDVALGASVAAALTPTPIGLAAGATAVAVSNAVDVGREADAERRAARRVERWVR